MFVEQTQSGGQPIEIFVRKEVKYDQVMRLDVVMVDARKQAQHRRDLGACGVLVSNLQKTFTSVRRRRSVLGSIMCPVAVFGDGAGPMWMAGTPEYSED